jgi:hypothetical protein
MIGYDRPYDRGVFDPPITPWGSKDGLGPWERPAGFDRPQFAAQIAKRCARMLLL